LWQWIRKLMSRSRTPVFDPPPADKPPYWCDGQIVRDGAGKWYRYSVALNTLEAVVMASPERVPDDGGPLPSIAPYSAPSNHPVIHTAKVIPLNVANAAKNVANATVAIYDQPPATSSDPELAAQLDDTHSDLVAGLGHRPDFTDLWHHISHELAHAQSQVRAQAVSGIRIKR
jgi:hypothetical protein